MMVKKILILCLVLIFCSFNFGCNTIVGTAKGIAEDVRSIVPGV